jgi:hypothetical protein
MRVRFTHDHDHVTPEKTTAFQKDQELTVAKEIGEAAVQAGKAEEVPLLKEQEAEEPPKRKASRADRG